MAGSLERQAPFASSNGRAPPTKAEIGVQSPGEQPTNQRNHHHHHSAKGSTQAMAVPKTTKYMIELLPECQELLTVMRELDASCFV